MNTQLATRDNRKFLMELHERLDARKDELKKALPSDISPDRFIRAVTTSAQVDPNILACNFQSLWIACMRACRDQLLPDGRQGAIVPFGDKAQWMPMVQGMVLRFQRSGQFKWMTADVVRDGELLEHWVTQEGVHFRHVPGYNTAAKLTKVYAVATTKDGGHFVCVMPIGDADKRKNMSRTTRDDSAWKKWPEEMYKKTVLKQLCKMLPGADDFDDEEFRDEIENESRPQYGGVDRNQPATVAERLDQFANVASSSGGVDRNAKPDAAEEAGPSSEHGDGEQVDATPSTAEAPAAADHEEITDEERAFMSDDERKRREAYEAGKEAKRTGIRYAAVPGEYRDMGKLMAAWRAGWHGEPLV